jgi:hypothetical protein
VYSEANDRVAAVIIDLAAGRAVYTRDDSILSCLECFEQVCDYGPGYFIATESAPLLAHNAEAAKPGNIVVDHTGTVYITIAQDKCAFEKAAFVHGHRLTSVAQAAMTMRVSATSVSCS